MLEFGSGGITSIATGGSLELDGSGAQILTKGGASSGLSGLDANHGTVFICGGDNGLGAGGVTLTTTSAFTNYVTTEIDYYGGDGGSSVTFGGALTNDATLDIGNTGLSASTTVKATTLATDGTFVLQGNSTSGTADGSFILSGKAASTVTGYLRVGGDATLEFGSGGITSIASGGWLELDGSSAQILTKGGAGDGLSGLTANDGTFVLRGDTNLGSGGAALRRLRRRSPTTATPTSIPCTAATAAAPRPSAAPLTNDATLNIGNNGLSGSTTVKATTFANNGTFNLQGNTASGTTDKASLILSGAGPRP